MSGRLKIIVINLLVLVVLLGVIEILLRNQTKTDLEFKPDSLDRFSNYIHHSEDRRAKRKVHGQCGSEEPVSILFLGDSWVEQGGIAHSVSENLSELTGRSNRCVESINAGVSSYSPSLYILKARRLLGQSGVSPDIVVINIDETDLMDEWLRYKDVSIRDNDGKLLAVSGARDKALKKIKADFLLGLNEHGSYLVRLIKREVLRGFVSELRSYGYEVRPEYETLLAPQMSDHVMEEYAEEVKYFESRIDELIDELVDMGVTKNRIFMTYHPHYLGVFRNSGKKYNRVVPDALAGVLESHGIAFYEATVDNENLQERDPTKIFKWPEDRFSHLTPERYEEYGELIYNAFSGQFRLLLNGHAQ